MATRLDHEKRNRRLPTEPPRTHTKKLRSFPARYAGPCPACGNEIEPGDTITSWDRTTRRYAHLTCVQAPT